MNLNEDTIKGKWLELQGDVQKAWGKLTSDELQKSKGDMKTLAGLVQQKYGEDREQFDKKMNEILTHFSDDKTAH